MEILKLDEEKTHKRRKNAPNIHTYYNSRIMKIVDNKVREKTRDTQPMLILHFAVKSTQNKQTQPEKAISGIGHHRCC